MEWYGIIRSRLITEKHTVTDDIKNYKNTNISSQYLHQCGHYVLSSRYK